MKKVLFIFAVFLCLLKFIGCHRESARREIVFWAFGAEGENVKPLIREFSDSTGVKVKLQTIPWTAAHEKLLTAYAAGAMPDICQLGNTWIPEFVALNAVVPLDEFIERSGRIDRNFYFPGIWETNILGGKVFGIPWYVDTRVVFYRKDLIRKAGYTNFPKTFDDLLKLSRAIVSGKLAKYAILLPVNEWNIPVLFGLQFGADFLKENNCYGDFSSSEFQEAFDYLLGFYKERLAPVGLTEVSNIYQGFSVGYFAMLITGPWNLGEFRKRLPDSLIKELGVAPIPSICDTSYPGYSLAGGSSLVVFKSASAKAEVFKLIEFLSRPVSQVKFYRLTGDLPARLESWEILLKTEDEALKAFHLQLTKVKPTPKIPEWEQIAMKLQEYLEYAAHEKFTTDETLKRLDSEINMMLEKRRWLLNRCKK